MGLFVFCLLFPVGLAQPGTLLDVRFVGSLSPADITAATAGRFRNNGVAPLQPVTSVRSYIVVFESTGVDGEPAPVTAQVLIPDTEPTATFVFGAGSTGLVEACAPSRNYVTGGGFDTYGAYALAYAGQGFVSVLPNYQGFFDVGILQPYFSRTAGGYALLDAGRMLTVLAQQEDFTAAEPVFFGGYSQGGHAAFAAADLAAEYAPELTIGGVLGFGPTTDLERLFTEFTYVAPWVVYAYDTFFPERIGPAEILAEPYAARLSSDAERFCEGGVQSYYPADPARLYTPGFAEALAAGTLAEAFPEVHALLAENDAGLSGHDLPAIILQGVDDPVVSLESQRDFVAALCERGSRVRFPNYLRTRHETRYIGFESALAWMTALVGGEEPPSDCDTL